MIWTYIIIAVLLLVAELVYFRIADNCNIIDKPNERSSHSTVVLRGGGVIFAISMIAWAVMMVFVGKDVVDYMPFLCGLVLVAGISFIDDIRSLPDSLRMSAQIVATLLMFWSAGVFAVSGNWLSTVVIAVVALFFCVGATNFINFMDGINGITAAYSLGMLVPLLLVNRSLGRLEVTGGDVSTALDMTGGDARDDRYWFRR